MPFIFLKGCEKEKETNIIWISDPKIHALLGSLQKAFADPCIGNKKQKDNFKRKVVKQNE